MVHHATCCPKQPQHVEGKTGAHNMVEYANNQEAFCQTQLQQKCIILTSEARLIIFQNDLASTHLTNEL